MRLRKNLLFIIMLVFAFGNAKTQIFSPSASDSFNATYGADKVFVFNRPAFDVPVNASIIAVSPDQLAGWTFQWAVYVPALDDYIDFPFTLNGSTSSIDTITVSSGYRVHMTNGSVNDTFRVWIIINDLDVKITNKGEGDTLHFAYFHCESLDLRADTIRPPLFYYHPVNHTRIYAGNTYTIRWSADNSSGGTPPSRLLSRVTDPPWQDTWYTITITDSYGIERHDSVFYKSIQSKAEISYKYIRLDTAEYPDRYWYQMFYDYDTYSAPAEFEFDVSASKNMSAYLLVFGDGDSVMLGNDSLTVRHVYKKPGQYKAVLTTKSFPPDECTDSISAPVIIVPEATNEAVNIPNIFTPAKNQRFQFDDNDIFRTSEVSVIFIEISIFTRTGRKVHEFEGLIRDWEGWDGSIMGGRDAPEGVYFYVITRFDAYQSKTDPIKKDRLTGFIHLYRK